MPDRIDPADRDALIAGLRARVAQLRGVSPNDVPSDSPVGAEFHAVLAELCTVNDLVLSFTGDPTTISIAALAELALTAKPAR